MPIISRIVKLENHKFLDDEEDSIIIKQVIFRMINTNLPVFYALSEFMKNCSREEFEVQCTEEELENQYFSMYVLILGLVVTKIGSTLCSRYLLNYLLWTLGRKSHFKAISAKAALQYENYKKKDKNNKDSWDRLKPDEKAKFDNRNRYALEEGLIIDKSAEAKVPAAKKKGCCSGGAATASPPYNRMVLNDTKKDKSGNNTNNFACLNPILIDHVEVNGILKDNITTQSI